MNPVIDRLMEERKKWRKDTPKGFSANPTKDAFGNVNLFKWECEVPGPRRTRLDKGKYRFIIEFDKNSLKSPLNIYCNSYIGHPNIKNGYVCSTVTNIWPECGLKQILFALQTFLESPWRPTAATYGYLNKRKDVEDLNGIVATLTSGGGGDGDIEMISID